MKKNKNINHLVKFLSVLIGILIVTVTILIGLFIYNN